MWRWHDVPYTRDNPGRVSAGHDSAIFSEESCLNDQNFAITIGKPLCGGWRAAAPPVHVSTTPLSWRWSGLREPPQRLPTGTWPAGGWRARGAPRRWRRPGRGPAAADCRGAPGASRGPVSQGGPHHVAGGPRRAVDHEGHGAQRPPDAPRGRMLCRGGGRLGTAHTGVPPGPRAGTPGAARGERLAGAAVRRRRSGCVLERALSYT